MTINSLLKICAGIFLGVTCSYVFKVGHPLSDEKDKPHTQTTSKRSTLRSKSNKRGIEHQKKDHLDSTQQRSTDLINLIDQYSAFNQDEYATEADKLNSMPFEKKEYLGYALFSCWAQNNPKEAMIHASRMGKVSASLSHVVLMKWASDNPKEAANYVKKNQERLRRLEKHGHGVEGSSIRTVASQWAKINPLATLDWASTLLPTNQSTVQISTLREWSKTDPKNAANAAKRFPARTKKIVYATIAENWATKDWNEAKTWITGLPKTEQEEAIGAAVKALSKNDLIAANEEVSNMPHGAIRRKTERAIAKNLALKDPAVAAQWLTEHADTTTQIQATPTLIENWVKIDPHQAQLWATQRPEGDLRDSAISVLVATDPDRHPEEKLNLAFQLSDPATKTTNVIAIASQWLKQTPHEATRYIDQSPHFTEEIKHRLLTP